MSLYLVYFFKDVIDNPSLGIWNAYQLLEPEGLLNFGFLNYKTAGVFANFGEFD